MNSLATSPASSSGLTSAAAIPEVSVLRLYLLRVGYALLAVGLGLYVWPDVIHHTNALAAKYGIRVSLLAGLGAAAALGLRYPLQMLPLLIFELVWKAIFLLAFALPFYLSHQFDAAMVEDTSACLMVLIFIPLIPWRYVVAQYVLKRDERWK